MESAGITRVVTIDLHAAQIQGFFNIPFDHMPGGPILAEYIKEKNLDDMIVVSLILAVSVVPEIWLNV